MGGLRDRMLAGELYRGADEASLARYGEVQRVLARVNDPGCLKPERMALLRGILRSVGDDVTVRPRFFCEYGEISIGAGTFVNVDAVVLDVAAVTIGAACQLGPRVQLLTADHPIDPAARRELWESARPIVLEDNVWLGGGVIVLPGVTIGADTVVGAGAVVTKSLPPGVVAGGVPARVLRDIGPGDRVEVSSAG